LEKEIEILEMEVLKMSA